MKVNCALVASLLIRVCDLLTGVRAYSDYNAELDARDNIDYLSTRDFAYDYQDLDAREPAAIEVPFHYSIRDFLKEAAIMHRRGFFDSPKPIANMNFYIGPPVTQNRLADIVEIYDKDNGRSIKKRIKELVKTRKHFDLPEFTLKVGEIDKGEQAAKVLEDNVTLKSFTAQLQLNAAGPIQIWGVRAGK
ncbi:hypothetical protein DFP72DRAFT_894872 [Ephemerocybe angulata]|uniref:Uncharacterized protein n=1 Tax=Ephemerocybe angulata TaxID=980116 RepID=A0A8H6I1A1_9AGAR|nr:hypothetical protein DFP72DRAFT_923274 [Tulosesus angulatus]KAF6756209.1 hypothetical protein DFP72DRAFT_894872 [Tulosesus angulatus]